MLSSHLAFDGFAFTMYNSVRSNNTVRRRVRLNDFKLDASHAASHEKDVSFPDGPVSFQKVGLQKYFEEISKSYKMT